jgi:hypothetical protein
LPKFSRFAGRYAAKFAAETVNTEPAIWLDPTDEAFEKCFANCARIPPRDMYPLIRDVFLAEYGPKGTEMPITHMTITASELRDGDLLHIGSSTNYVLVAHAELDAHKTIAVTTYDGNDVVHDKPFLHFYPWEQVELSSASPGRLPSTAASGA